MKVKHLLGIIAMALVTIGVVTFFSSKDGNTGSSNNGPVYLYSITGATLKSSLKQPAFAISDPKGDVFVADSGNHRVRVFSPKGLFLFEFGGPESPKPLVYPYGIGILKGKIIVADTGAGALYEFTPKGQYVKTWLDTKAKAQPAGVYVDRNRDVYVSDLAGKQILVFSEVGKLLRKIKPRQVSLGAPQGLTVNDDGTVWVADGGNYNIKLLKPNGDLQTIFDGGPKLPLTTAKGLAVDKQGRIYVADTLSNVIRVFDKEGKDLLSFGTDNKKKGSLKLPVGLSVDDEGKIYIADQGNNVVQVWGWK